MHDLRFTGSSCLVWHQIWPHRKFWKSPYCWEGLVTQRTRKWPFPSYSLTRHQSLCTIIDTQTKLAMPQGSIPPSQMERQFQHVSWHFHQTKAGPHVQQQSVFMLFCIRESTSHFHHLVCDTSIERISCQNLIASGNYLASTCVPPYAPTQII